MAVQNTPESFDISTLKDSPVSFISDKDSTQYKFKQKIGIIRHPLDHNKTMKLLFTVVPAGTIFYRGVGINCNDVTLDIAPVDGTYKKFIFFTHLVWVAKFYSKNVNCMVKYKTKRDLVLLDLWNPFTMNYMNEVLNSLSDESYLDNFLMFTGTRYEVPIYRNPNYIQEFKQSFPDSKELRDGVFKYRGLDWGNSVGQYKRDSLSDRDNLIYEALFNNLPFIDGIYSPDVPSFNHFSYTDESLNTTKFTTFHTEIVIQKPYSNKLEFIEKTVGGLRRTKKQKLHKKRKTYKRR